jgi:hypothetical protein
VHQRLAGVVRPLFRWPRWFATQAARMMLVMIP